MFDRVRRTFTSQKSTNFASPRPNRDENKSELPTPREAQPVAVQPTPAAQAAATTDHQNTDEHVEQTAGRDAADTRAPRTGIVPVQQVTQNQTPAATQAATPAEPANEFQSFWHREIDYQMEDIVLDETNYWTPNAFSMNTTLNIIGNFLSTNTHIRKYFPNYCHPATVIYYSVLFYVQILRARKAADKLTGVERKFLRRFEGKFPFESLVITGPLFPIFSTIIATMIGDGKYDWNVPQIAPGMFAATLSAFAPTHGSCFLQPQVPYMIGILRSFIMDTFRTAVSVRPDGYLTDDDQLVLNNFETTASVTLFGIDFKRGTSSPPDSLALFAASGISSVPYIGLDVLAQAGPTWNRSKFNQVQFAAYTPVTGTSRSDRKVTDTAGNTKISDLANFLCMPEEQNMEWFEFCVEHAIIQAKFAKSKYNLSNVPTTGGNETLILARFRHHKSTNAKEFVYENVRLDMTNETFDWYPDSFDRMTAAFATDRANFKRSEELQAFSFAPNACLPVILNSQRVGDSEAHRLGSYYAPDTKERIRAGHRIDPGQNVGKPMFSRWNDLFLQNFLVSKPDIN